MLDVIRKKKSQRPRAGSTGSFGLDSRLLKAFRLVSVIQSFTIRKIILNSIRNFAELNFLVGRYFLNIGRSGDNAQKKQKAGKLLWEGNIGERHTVPVLECNTQVFKGFTGAFHPNCTDKGYKTAE